MTPPAVFRRTLFPAESHSCAGKECEEEKKNRNSVAGIPIATSIMVEHSGFEPLTLTLPV